MEGARETERLLRQHGSLALIALARTRKGERHTYLLKEIPTSSLLPVRSAFASLFVRNEVKAYFFGLRGYLVDENDSVRVSASSAGSAPEARREVRFYVSADDYGACQAYSEVTWRPNGELEGLSCLHAMPVDSQGPFLGLLNPAVGLGAGNEAYVLAEQLECGRLLGSS